MLRAPTAVLLSMVTLGAQSTADVTTTLNRVAAYVEDFSARAHRVLAEETIVYQPLARDYSPAGFPRRLVYDLRFEWSPTPAPGDSPLMFVRNLVSASGPEIVPNEQECLAPPAVSPQRLAFLRAEERGAFVFEAQERGRADGRPALVIGYRPRDPASPHMTWMGACARADLSGRKRGRIWIDAQSGAVLKIEERLVGPVDLPGPPDRPWRPDWFTFERDDVSIEYTTVTFSDPPESLILPERLERLSVVRNAALTTLRITHTFRNYRRFLTESRIVR